MTENIQLVESGRLRLPPQVDVAAFLLSDGAINRDQNTDPRTPLRTFEEFSHAFLSSIPTGSLEKNTQHDDHPPGAFQESARRDFRLPLTQLEDLQKYVEIRSMDKGNRGKTLSPTTIRREIATLRLLTVSEKAGQMNAVSSRLGHR